MPDSTWHDFFAAAAGAAATLTGLVFVGVSLSLGRILEKLGINVWALEALLFFMLVVVIALLGLVPQQRDWAFGLLVLSLTGALETVLLLLWRRLWRATPAPYVSVQQCSFAFSQLTLLPFVLSAAYLLAGQDTGLYWLVLAFLLAFARGIRDAWGILLEIHR